MLVSMTGFGSSSYEDSSLSINIELNTAYVTKLMEYERNYDYSLELKELNDLVTEIQGIPSVTANS